MSARRKTSAEYEVGYGKPPAHSRFQKGRSGNPKGRPRRTIVEQANALALEEAYRPVTVREGENVISLPAIRAVMRSQIALAAKGNGPAQRALISVIREIERAKADSAGQMRHEDWLDLLERDLVEPAPSTSEACRGK